MKNFLKKLIPGLLISLISIIICLAIIEIFVRIFYPQELVYLNYSEIWRPDDILGHKHKSNVSIPVNIENRIVQFKTDEHGFRIGMNEIIEPDYKILALGDSFIEALHVEHEETVTGLLESSLTAMSGLNIKITNTGVAGWDPSHYLLQAETELNRDEYDFMVVFLYVGNDFERRERQYEFTPLTERQIEQRYDLRIPRNFSKEELINSVLYPINNFLETRSVSYVFFKQKARVSLMRIGFTADYFPKVFLKSTADSPVFRIVAETCADIRDLALEHQIETIFVLIPTSQQVQEATFKEFVRGFNIDASLIDINQSSYLIEQEFNKFNLFLIDSLDALKEEHERTGIRLYGEISNHFNAEGHKALANFLQPTLEKILPTSIEFDL